MYEKYAYNISAKPSFSEHHVTKRPAAENSDAHKASSSSPKRPRMEAAMPFLSPLLRNQEKFKVR